MTPRRVLITGAAGFVGTHLMAALREAFPEAVLTGTASAPAPGFTPLDVTGAASVAAVVEAARPDACVHLAAVTAVPDARRDPDRAWRVNLHGTLRLAAALRRIVPECPLVFSSSAEIYGASFAAGIALDETALPAPGNTYAATKAAADLALGALAAEGARVVRLRLFNHTGPGQAESFVVPAFARQIARVEAGLQPPVLRTGDLTPRRDFLDVRDVCRAYVACLSRADALAPGTILNIASGIPREIGGVLRDLIALAGVDAAIESAPALRRATDTPLAIGDSAKARALLDWQPAIPWEQTLRDVLADWRRRAVVPPRHDRG